VVLCTSILATNGKGIVTYIEKILMNVCGNGFWMSYWPSGERFLNHSKFYLDVKISLVIEKKIGNVILSVDL